MESQEQRQRIDNALVEENPDLRKALDSVKKVNRRIARSSRIVSVEIQFELDDDLPPIQAPKRKIKLRN